MKRIVKIDQIPFEDVDWGLTKTIIGPLTTGSQNVQVKITEYLPGYVHEPHVHKTQEEVIYVLSGTGISEIAGERNEIGPGCMAYVPAGIAHATINMSQSESLKAVIIKSPPGNEEERL